MIARFAASLIVFLLAGTALSAHPTASTFVVIRVPGDGTIGVSITANAEALALTLAGLADGPAQAASPSPRHRIDALRTELLRLTDLQVDGMRLPLAWVNTSVVDDRPESLTVRLAGVLPAGASSVRWRAAYLLGAYPLAVVGGSAEAQPDSYDWLAGREQSRTYDLAALGAGESVWRNGVRLVGTGFAHIVPGGLDHVLFVLGLFLLAANVRTLLVQISTFTVAHSLTLALGVFGLIRIPGWIVEPLIAASIVFVAVENLVTSSVSRRRVFVVFLFGLLHGLGFAGAMADLGLSSEHLVVSLVGFNAGVELGQLAVIAGAALLLHGLRLSADAERRFITRPASVAIALTGLFWAIERL